ncbi:MAG: cation transporter [Kofleriaceae bacterium]
MTTTLRITGMTCNNCVRHVDSALRQVPGVAKVAVSLPEGQAMVDHDDLTTLPALLAAVVSAGYEATVTDPPARA